MQFLQVFENSTSVIVYRDSVPREFYKGGEEFSEIIAAWCEMTEGALDMPAYGVSIDKLTRNEMQHGDWVEFMFDGQCEFNEMPFEKLLIKVEEGNCGFNVIRYSCGGYSGRVFTCNYAIKTCLR